MAVRPLDAAVEQGSGPLLRKEMEVFGRVARHAGEDLKRLGHGPEAFGLVHRDPKLENLVFGG